MSVGGRRCSDDVRRAAPVVRQLLAAGLLDELHLLVHPIAVRTGMRLFDDDEAPIPLQLLSSQTFKTGVLNLVDGPAESGGDAGGMHQAKAHLPRFGGLARLTSRVPWRRECRRGGRPPARGRPSCLEPG